MMTMTTPLRWAACLALAATGDATAQSEAASDASALSGHLSIETSVATLAAIPAGSALVVSALRPAGKLIELTVVSAATGASVVVEVAASSVSALAMTTGTALSIGAIGSGWLVLAGSEAIAFIPNAIARSLIGDQALS